MLHPTLLILTPLILSNLMTLSLFINSGRIHFTFGRSVGGIGGVEDIKLHASDLSLLNKPVMKAEVYIKHDKSTQSFNGSPRLPQASTRLPILQHTPMMAKRGHLWRTLSVNHDNLSSENSRSSKI